MGMTLNAASDKLIFGILSALLLTGVIGGNVVHTENQMDIYDYKMGQIDKEMKAVVENPTDENIQVVYFDLMEEMQWSRRHISDRSSEYEAYLEACNDKLISLSNGNHEDMATTKNDNQNTNVNSPYLWAVAAPSN